jgi:MFS family permease
LVTKLGVKPLLGVGFLLGAAGVFAMTAISVHGSYLTEILPGMVVMGFGSGLCFSGFSIASIHGVTSEDASLASGVQNAVQQVGGAIGLAVLATVALRHTTSAVRHGVSAASASTAGTVLAYRIGAAIMLVGALGVWAMFERIHAEDPSPVTEEALPVAA